MLKRNKFSRKGRRLFISFLSFFLFLVVAQIALSAGSSTTSPGLKLFPHNTGIYELTITYVADDTDGSIPDYVFTAADTAELKGGFVFLATTTPGTTAVDALSIVVTEALDADDGVDVFGGALATRSTTAGEQAVPTVVTSTPGLRLCTGKTWTVGFSGNSTNDATGILVLYFMR